MITKTTEEIIERSNTSKAFPEEMRWVCVDEHNKIIRNIFDDIENGAWVSGSAIRENVVSSGKEGYYPEIENILKVKKKYLFSGDTLGAKDSAVRNISQKSSCKSTEVPEKPVKKEFEEDSE